jgi:HlyD family secretion protein
MKIPPKRLLVPVAVALLAVMGLTAGWFLLRQSPLPEGLIQANGRIEGDHYLVAGKMPGRVAELFAREGDAVQKDQVLLRLDAAQVDASVVICS